jgi:excisionase family DNA binding protein
MEKPTIAANSKLLLGASDLAALLSISEATLWRWLSAGKIPAPTLRQGQVVRWSRAKIEAWIEEGCPDCTEVEAR